MHFHILGMYPCIQSILQYILGTTESVYDFLPACSYQYYQRGGDADQQQGHIHEASKERAAECCRLSKADKA